MPTTFKGIKELDAYVNETDVPSFCEFVQRNGENIMGWSTGGNRFALSLRTHNKMQLICDSKNQYDKDLWEIILNGTKSLRNSQLETTVNAINNATLATNVALNLLSNAYVAVPSSTDAIEEKDIMVDGELVCILLRIKSDRSPKSDLLCLSSKLLQKQKLSVLEESALEKKTLQSKTHHGQDIKKTVRISVEAVMNQLLTSAAMTTYNFIKIQEDIVLCNIRISTYKHGHKIKNYCYIVVT
ncbi:hypothetical protein BDC45DRAFT_532528 [Circinella umbellata]|nr:hypothetical protein BDC45DRAFT_532528 [Circinella umbellata]